MYNLARQALGNLGEDELIFTKYLPIEKTHLTVNKDIIEANRYGQRSDRMPWFWRTGYISGETTDDWLQECRIFQLPVCKKWNANIATYKFIELAGIDPING